jgi:hypothetical protein
MQGSWGPIVGDVRAAGVPYTNPGSGRRNDEYVQRCIDRLDRHSQPSGPSVAANDVSRATCVIICRPIGLSTTKAVAPTGGRQTRTWVDNAIVWISPVLASVDMIASTTTTPALCFVVFHDTPLLTRLDHALLGIICLWKGTIIGRVLLAHGPASELYLKVHGPAPLDASQDLLVRIRRVLT